MAIQNNILVNRRQWSVRTCFCECEQNAFFSGITLFIWNISLLCNSVGQWSFTVLQKNGVFDNILIKIDIYFHCTA